MSEPASRAAPARFLALGDSYTAGEGVALADAWPHQLARALRARGIATADPTIVARTGWTTDELRAAIDAAIDAAALAPAYDLVTLLIGVNDQYRGRAAADFRGGLASVLDRALSFAGGHAKRVVMVSIPDWSVTPFAADHDRAAIAEQITAYNGVVESAARRVGARLVDVTASSRRAGDDASLLAPDGLHPSAAMYAEWTRLLLPIAAAALAADAGR